MLGVALEPGGSLFVLGSFVTPMLLVVDPEELEVLVPTVLAAGTHTYTHTRGQPQRIV